jgi:hypothetical protein
MKHLLLLFMAGLLFFATGCKKENLYCGVNDPLAELPWLNALLADTTITKISKANYQANEGFVIKICYNADCNATASGYLDCDGQPVCNFGSMSGNSCPDFSSVATNREVIYTR